MNKTVKMSRIELFKASGLLSAHCKVVDGFAVYEEGWSDKRVADESSDPARPLPMASVAKLRTEAVGVLRVHRSSQAAQQTAKRLELLDELMLKHNKLVETLSVNRVCDVRHLKVDSNG